MLPAWQGLVKRIGIGNKLVFPAWFAFSLTVFASIGLHDFVTGRRWLSDMCDSLHLGLRSLPAWDSHWAAQTHRSDILICLTTTPARLQRLAPVLKSLLAQSLAPHRIRLHLPWTSRREQRPYPLPAYLTNLRSLEIIRCDDFGPATKLIPALTLDSAQKILVVDDDALYPPTMLADFARWEARRPGMALALSGWRVPPNLTDRRDTWWNIVTQTPPAPVQATRLRRPYSVDILRGCDGYLVRPEFFDLDQVTDFSTAPALARWVDDVWMSAHCRVAKFVIPARRLPFFSVPDWFYFQRTALSRLNDVADSEQRANTQLIRHFKDRWLCARPGAV